MTHSVYEPECFEPGTLVILDRAFFNTSPPGTVGLILSHDTHKTQSIFGPQYTHSVLVGEKVYWATRCCFIGVFSSEN